MDRKSLILDLPPSVNHMYANVKVSNRSIKVLTKGAKKWYEDSLKLIQIWKRVNQWDMIDNKLIVRIWFYYPDYRRRDSHNYLKILMDVLETGKIYSDDRYALVRIMDYETDKKDPRVQITFEVI